MKVSIVTVSYNAEKTIESTIQSVLEQTHKDIEYIIIDGASTDGTLAIIDKYKSRISKCISESDKGLYYAMNKGIELASGDIVGVLNADDLYTNKDVIAKIVAKLQEDADCSAVYADLDYVKEEDVTQVVRKWVSGHYFQGAFEKGWMPPHPTFFVKRKCYEEFGLFNIDFKTSADYELMLRFINKHKIKVSYLAETIVKMRIGGQSNASFKNRLAANREDKKAWKINNLKPKPFTFIRKPLSKILQFIKR